MTRSARKPRIIGVTHSKVSDDAHIPGWAIFEERPVYATPEDEALAKAQWLEKMRAWQEDLSADVAKMDRP